MHAILIAGAAVVGLPILLHLIMKQQPKRLLFPAIRFLQQKQKTNQRKLRLRHFVLLALRVLLLALFCAALYQPTVSGDFRLVNLSGEQPIAAVVVMDTSPSMGYRQNNVSRLDDAKRRALELLDDLPAGSRVAVVEPNDPVGTWENSLGDARKRIESFAQPVGSTPPITSALPVVYQLLKTVDQEAPDQREPMPRLVAIFSDRTSACWDAARTEELKKLRDAVPEPRPVHLFVDVGSEAPTNVAITSAEIRPQLLSASMPAIVSVTVQATGADVPACEVTCSLDDASPPERSEKPLTAGSPTPFRFTFEKLKPGFHTARIRIRDDNLTIDNERFLTFAVATPRKILTIADNVQDAAYWQLAHREHREFDCDVITPASVDTFAGYEAVCLMNVADPTVKTKSGKPLWEVLKEYVENGGRLLIAPGPLQPAQQVNYNEPAAARDIMPGKLDKVRDWSLEPPPKVQADPTAPRPLDRRFGVVWKTDTPRDTTHPMLAPFNEWRLKGNVNVLRNPRPAARYWLVERHPDASTVVYYDDADDEKDRQPAILERSVGKGKVLLLTTRIDTQDDAATRWNEYWATTDSSWPVVFPNLIARYLAGSPDDAIYNFPAGQEIVVPLPAAVPGKKRTIVLEGPGISGRDAFPEISDAQTELRLSRSRTAAPGFYTVRTEDRSWEYRIGTNTSADESLLDKVPEPAIDALFGEKSVIPLSKGVKLSDALKTEYNQPIDLFPWLLLAVLLLFVCEGFLANRFDSLRR